jgi:hypothetical protein
VPVIEWWRGLEPLDALAPGAGSEHRVEWRDGEFSLAEHGDPDAERALGALGGERCGCLDLYDAWQAQHVDGAILVVGARDPDEQLEVPTRATRHVLAEVTRWRGHLAALQQEARSRADQAALSRLQALAAPTERVATRRIGFLHLLALPPAMQHRLQASVAAALAHGGAASQLTLTVATSARAGPLLRSLGWAGTLFDIELTATDLAEAMVGESVAVLPGAWVSEVWGRGLGVVGDYFVLGVNAMAPGGAGFEVIATQPGKAPVTLVVEQWENAWRTT